MVSKWQRAKNTFARHCTWTSSRKLQSERLLLTDGQELRQIQMGLTGVLALVCSTHRAKNVHPIWLTWIAGTSWDKRSLKARKHPEPGEDRGLRGSRRRRQRSLLQLLQKYRQRNTCSRFSPPACSIFLCGCRLSYFSFPLWLSYWKISLHLPSW